MSEQVKTKNVEAINNRGTDNQLHVWHNDDPDFGRPGWYACFSGYHNGMYSESDNFGPFDTEAEAWEDIEIQYQEWHSN